MSHQRTLALGGLYVPSDAGVFDVECRGKHYMVNLQKKSCACRRWDMSGIPCNHAIACLRHDNILPEEMVHPCYSISKFRAAYSHVIYPCRDRTEWPKVNGRPVLPPIDEKKVGRPAKNRRKQPEEIEGPNGEKKMSRHGRIMHCSHCGGSSHNRGGYYYYKNGIDPKLKESTRIGVQHHVQIEVEDDPVITQDHSIFEPTTMPTDSAIASLKHESQDEQSQAMPTQHPLPECEFLASQVDLTTQRPMPPSQAQLAEAARLAKQKALAEKKEAEQLKKLEQAQKKAEQAALKKQALAEKKPQEAELKKIALAQKRAQEAELKKIALAQKRAQVDEARKIGAEEKRIAAELKKAQAEEARQRTMAEKRAQAEEAKKKAKSQLNKRPADTSITRPGKRVSMFDDFRDPPRSQPPADH